MMNGREGLDTSSGEATLQNELQSLAGMLDRRKWLIIASVIATMALALVFTLRQQKVYSSSAVIAVTAPATGAASQTDQATASATAASSQIVIMSSSGYREAAAKALESDRKSTPNTAIATAITPFQIASRVSSSTVGQTALIKVTATGPTPGAAKELAQRFADYSVKQATDQATASAEQQRSVLQDQATAIRKQISSLENDIKGATGSNADNIQQQIDAARQALTNTTLAAAAATADSPTLKVVSASTENATPISPRLKFNLAIAGVVGLLLGLVLAWIRDQLDRTVRSVDEIETLTDRPVLATIPLVRQPDALSTPALADAYSFLRVNLGVTLGSNRGSVITLTSSREGEGKTSTTIGLGRSLVGAGRRVLLMDVDLRRGGLSRTLGVDGRRGLTECLRGELAPEDALVMVGGMYVFPAGSGDLNSAALLDSARFENLLQDLRETYDYVLVDTTPARAIADAVLVGARSDGILLVSRAGLVDRRELVSASNTLRSAAFNLLGVVVYTPEASEVGYEYQMVDPAPSGRKRRLAR